MIMMIVRIAVMRNHVVSDFFLFLIKVDYKMIVDEIYTLSFARLLVNI